MSCWDSFGGDFDDDDPEYEDRAIEAIQADVYMISGCQDKQTSADVSNVASFGVDGPGGAGGACTNALLRQENQPGDCSWVEMLQGMRGYLDSRGYSQIPQLSTSRKLDLNQPWEIGGGYGGTRKALMIGINYVGHSGGVLSGCINDAAAMKEYICNNEGFQEDDYTMRVLVDDHDDPTVHNYFSGVSVDYPTKRNILEGFRWLVSGAQPGDCLFVHYSGHGGQQRDEDGDEEDGKDETLCPCDYPQQGTITDDDVFRELVQPLPAGVRLVCLMDCCHSGTILDLPFQFTANDATLGAVAQGHPPQTYANPGFKSQLGKFLGKYGHHLPPEVQGFMGMAKKFGLF